MEVANLLARMGKTDHKIEMKPSEMLRYRQAIENNHEQVIADFIQFNSQFIDYVHEDGCTLLCLATRYGRTNIVEMLLKEGADPNIPQTYMMNTPLHYAVNLNSKIIINLLIHYGADEKIKNNNGLTPW